MDAIWDIPIIDGPVPWIVYGTAIVIAVVLVLRRPTVRNVVLFAVCVFGMAIVGVALFFVLNALDAFGTELPHALLPWVIAAFGGIGLSIASMIGSRVWRTIVAAVGIVAFVLTGTLGINAYYGLNPTLGSLFGIIVEHDIPLPTPNPDSTAAGPLYQSWQPPAGMPSQGTQGTQQIPGTVSGFTARPAGIYLPPAALVADPPALPLVVMMMGHPGNPDPTAISAVLDTFAAQHEGLAPIVIVADQLGHDGTDDPACADSSLHGNAETYINVDVVNWAKKNLNVLQDASSWVIAGYSNGGGCAIKYGAEHPDIWKNIIDVSGEEFPGSEDQATVVAQIYGGDQASFDAVRPISTLQRNTGKYAGVTAVFSAGANDPEYVAAATKVADAAKAAGMTTTLDIIPGADHGGTGLNGGLTEGFTVLYPVLGLSAP